MSFSVAERALQKAEAAGLAAGTTPRADQQRCQERRLTTDRDAAGKVDRTAKRPAFRANASAPTVTELTRSRADTEVSGPTVPPVSHASVRGCEWIYVLAGHMRLVLGDEDWVLGPGEVAEFDTQVPHWFGSTGEEPADILSIFARPVKRMSVRTRHPQH